MKKLILYIFVAAIAEVSFSERFDRVKFNQDVVTNELDPQFSSWNETSPQWFNDLQRLDEYYVSLCVTCTSGDGRQRSVFASQDGTTWKRVCNFEDNLYGKFCHQIVPHNNKYIVTYTVGSGIRFGYYEIDDISQMLNTNALRLADHNVNNTDVFGSTNLSASISVEDRGMTRLFWSIYFDENGTEHRLFNVAPRTYSDNEEERVNNIRTNFYGKLPKDNGIYKLYISSGTHGDESSFTTPVEVSKTNFFASRNWLVDRINEPTNDNSVVDSLIDPKMHVFNINGTNKYVLAIQDHYRYGIRIFTSTNPISEFRASASLFDQRNTLYLEGPTIIQSGNKFILYAIEYSQGYVVCFVTEDPDFKNWSQPSPVYFDRVVNESIFYTKMHSLYPVNVKKSNKKDGEGFGKLMLQSRQNPFQSSSLNGYTPPYQTSILLRDGSISNNNPLVLFPGAIYQPDIDRLTNNVTISYIDSSFLKVGDTCYFYVPHEGANNKNLNITFLSAIKDVVMNYRFSDKDTDNVRVIWSPDLTGNVTIGTRTHTCNTLVPVRRVKYPNGGDRVLIEFPQMLIWQAINGN